MLRFPLSIRCRQESCSLLLRRTFSSAADSGSGEEGDSNKGKQKLENELPKKIKLELRKEKSASAKLKLSGLISSLATNKSASPPPEQTKPAIKLSQPKPRGIKAKAMEDPVEREMEMEYKEAGPALSSAIKSVADEIGGGLQTESELLKSLKKWHKKVPDDDDDLSQSDLKDVLSNISVDKTQQARPVKPATNTGAFRRDYDQQTLQDTRLFDAEPLNIFPMPEKRAQQTEQPVERPILATWNALEARDLELSIAQPPANHFQELVLWTKQGKIWHFPIDNEYGLEEEKRVGFQEHIFLERNIANWCPKIGPIAVFMEIACVGLSKNPHITVKRKKDILEWYRQFFDERKALLEEVGALPSASIPTSSSTV